MDNDSLYIEDWKLTKDRIKHFDDIIIKIRLQGIPIAGALFSVGAYLVPILKENSFMGLGNAAPIPFLILFVYVFALMLLDFLHFKLLLVSVKHAKEIENLSQFKGLIVITTKLTKNWITYLHFIIAVGLYIPILILSLMTSFSLMGQV